MIFELAFFTTGFWVSAFLFDGDDFYTMHKSFQAGLCYLRGHDEICIP